MDYHAYLKLLRPHQWLKNLMLLFPPFLAGKIFSVAIWQQILFSFVAFSLAASATYVFNDIIDRHADKLHPKKCLRPLPAGTITVAQAYSLALFLTVIAISLGLIWAQSVLVWLLAYILLSLLYTLVLKNILLLDLLTIAAFFLLRLQAGGAASHVNVSVWLFLSVLLLAFYLSAGKRLGEIKMLGANAHHHRSSLAAYTPRFLSLVLYVTSVTVLLTYSIYCYTHDSLFYTIPLCAYGLFRYIYRVQHGGDGDPTAALLKDPRLLIVGLCWVLMVGVDIYF
ncbi:4-hydroxybenzoate polyprenyltransferase [Desulfuromusa kysingii]|uniref:4-hydroxybenzoate polyprenyltransferase n=1 Tax=Desulfuromusa kysingii TaxID=37625 RepID=A0A1H4CWM5_9BACT|nr:decaprenyl-phosphate phosphoribosyltransferase [Desulfuromusa kysingii]SEA64855.1 4-hydroxybenzoate polyprenyltransferase [Desulfuromusa kysingii]